MPGGVVTESRKWYLTGNGKTGRWLDTGAFAPIAKRDPAAEVPNPKPGPIKLSPPDRAPAAAADVPPPAENSDAAEAPAEPPAAEAEPAAAPAPASIPKEDLAPFLLPPPPPDKPAAPPPVSADADEHSSETNSPNDSDSDPSKQGSNAPKAEDMAPLLGEMIASGWGGLLARAGSRGLPEPVPLTDVEHKRLAEASTALATRYAPRLETKHSELWAFLFVSSTVTLARLRIPREPVDPLEDAPPTPTETAPEPDAGSTEPDSDAIDPPAEVRRPRARALEAIA